MNTTAPAASPSPRSVLARHKLMRAAERLIAERGFAGVSVRQISEAAGQRNNSAVQYHFNGRDELIKAILSSYTDVIEERRIAMVEALGGRRISLEEHYRCLIMPGVEYHIEAPAPTWGARFLAQAIVEPALREYVIQEHLNTPSHRILDTYGALRREDLDPGLRRRHSAMVRQLTVHAFAELEHDLADGRIDRAEAEQRWRLLGEDLITALCGLSTALLGRA
ncbi:TetR family transcriptional regulator [Streptomyces sp. Ru73]|uniref:TetR/AcrR family transcriptional regulator n=1 Tax=Streptomyces sp. Ru73 TaxID=2080748 RepID=UPI000CDD754B|nr:TetR/AcrR family transcriptional regulator [Streptomyces sp. Ru73]POX43306.1 TetR family transcriptional regulator [Streptomyces sp. Ru73]